MTPSVLATHFKPHKELHVYLSREAFRTATLPLILKPEQVENS